MNRIFRISYVKRFQSQHSSTYFRQYELRKCIQNQGFNTIEMIPLIPSFLFSLIGKKRVVFIMTYVCDKAERISEILAHLSCIARPCLKTNKQNNNQIFSFLFIFPYALLYIILKPIILYTNFIPVILK